LAHRRQSSLMILLSLFLVKLWVDAIFSHDGGLLIFCILMTGLAIRAFRRRGEMEEELLRRRRAMMEEESQINENIAPDGIRSSGGVNPYEVRLLSFSFQAQLAHAIAESQRMHMMAQQNGGIMPMDVDSLNTGVSDSIRDQWKRWKYQKQDGYSNILKDDDIARDDDIQFEDKHIRASTLELKSDKTEKRIKHILKSKSKSNRKSSGQYGTLAKSDVEEGLYSDSPEQSSKSLTMESPLAESKDTGNADDNACSICLCDYEVGDELTRLPCGHIYHLECVTSWTNQSTRCPLCNHELQEEI